MSTTAELRAIELLRQLTGQLATVADLHTALHVTLGAALKVCAAARGTVHLRADGGQQLQLVAAQGFEDVAINTLEELLAQSDSTAHRAGRSQAPVAIADISAESIAESVVAAKLGYRAAYSVPLIDSDALLAVFTVYFAQPHPSADRELSWIEVYARQAAHVLKLSSAQSALVASEQRFRSIFQESNDFIVTADLHQTITYCNPATVAALGWPADQIVGHSIAEFIPAPHFDRTSSMLSQKLREGGSTRYEVDVMTRDGRRMTWEINSRLTFGPDGKPTGLHAIGRDVTTMRAAHEALRTSERALREADQRKDEFLAMLAHELRNPLAPIRTAAQILKRSSANPEQLRHASEIVERQVEHITHIVDDLLDVARVTRGLVTLNRQPTSLHDVVKSAVEQVRPLIDARQHRLNITMPDERIILSGEAARLVQMVANLLSNAARHSGAGGNIELFVIAHLQLVEIHVRDFGTGIAPELLPHVFELFTQADRSAARSEGGLGIGLALVRRLAELHGGHAEAASAGLGCGAEFTVVLPRLADQPIVIPVAESSPSQQTSPLRILVVDDNEDAAMTLAMLLRMDGHEAFVEFAAMPALVRARATKPDVMLLDIGLPEIDGYELARRLRSDPDTGSACLIAITGYGQEEDRQRSREAGFDHHLMKPVNAEDLRRTLAGAGSVRRQ
jgi:PAS domain S-box-containing protein